MRKIFHCIKSLFRPVIHGIRKKQLRSKLLVNMHTQNLAYSFTNEDIELYVQERFTPLPTLVVEKTEDASLVTVTINSTKIYWPASQSELDLPWLFHEVFDNFKTNPSSYDNSNLAYETRSWIIDAGAAEGYFSIFALKKSNASLICIEPLPIMKMALEKTLSLYPNGKPSIIISSALSDKPGLADIQIDENHICDSKLVSTSSSAVELEGNSTSQRVPVTTLDQIAIDRKLGVNGLIKMDIEGYEMLALTGAVNLMRKFKPALAVAVYHDLDNAKKCAEIIKAANPKYKIEFRGFYGYFEPARPYMVFAY
jgi:FkbM family methyltransferase